MHVLTKIFIVLVSLLAVMMVPLVVVYAHNENSYEARFQAAEANAVTARNAASTADTRAAAETSRLNLQISELENLRANLQKDVSVSQSEIRRLESQLAQATAMDAEITAKLELLANALAAGQDVNGTLVEDLRTVRADALTAERARVQLDEALRDTTTQLEVAIEARKMLQEELQRMKDELASVLNDVAWYVQKYGPREGALAAGDSVTPIDVHLDATVVEVRRNDDGAWAEIDAGTRDGVKVGWVVPVSGPNGFVGNLRIVSVDINRSVGTIELETTAQGTIQVGDRVLARPARAGL